MDFVEEDKVLNLCNQNLKRLARNFVNKERAASISHLYLDWNELQKLEFLACFTSVVQFSATHNQLLRMYNIAPLKTLVSLDLSFNKIICIEGLKELVHLTTLNLSHNKIKEIDHMVTNVALEVLDLSDNLITGLSNISQLTKLKKLYLHQNMITQLRHAEVYLPKNIDTLTLANNKISDLNEISHLTGIVNLREISIKDNPCVDMTGQMIGFDYRPFLVNWCLELKVIDGYIVDELESLRGEWLYSQGKGRQFRLGEHAQLVQYLAEVLTFNNEPLQSEQERKLRLILSKAHQHQSQLMTESLTGGKSSSSQMMSRSLDPSSLQGYKENSSSPLPMLSQSLHCCPSTSFNKDEENELEEVLAALPPGSKQGRLLPQCLHGPSTSSHKDEERKQGEVPAPLPPSSKHSMANVRMLSQSLHGTPTSSHKDEESNLKEVPVPLPAASKQNMAIVQMLSQSLNFPSTSSHEEEGNKLEEVPAPLPAASKLVPVPESLISPMISNIPDITAGTSSTPSTSTSEAYICEEMSAMKLQTIKNKADEIRNKKSITDRDLAAICIQKNWRGYLTRNSSPSIQTFYQNIQVKRFSQHISKLSDDVRTLKSALENEHRLHVLQMQAINAVWRKVQQLQHSMQDVFRESAPRSSEVATQTEIVAVHTPEDSGFLYHRPSTLPLTTHPQPVSRFVDNLLGDSTNETSEVKPTEDQ